MDTNMDTNQPPLPTLIDSTMLTQFRACPRKFYHEYVLNLRPPGRKRDLVAGGAFAAALEAAYMAYFRDGLGEQESLTRAFVAFGWSWGDFPKDDLHLEQSKRSAKTFDRTFQAVCSYFETYPFSTDRVKPMLLTDGRPSYEFSFSIPLTSPHFPRHPTGVPFLYAGRFDAFGHMDDLLVIRDEKTTGQHIGTTWPEQWSVRNQFMGYTWAATQSGYPCSTAVIRGIQLLKTKFVHAEAVKTYSAHMMQLFETQLARDLHRMVNCYTQSYFDYDLGDSCTSFNRPCAFIDLCTTSTPEIWFGDYERVRWNPLTRTTEAIE